MNKTGVSFIGAGNVAWHLAEALEESGHQVREVFSRTTEHARGLANKLYNATPVQSLDFSNSQASVFIISVPDDKIAALAAKVVLPAGAILAHTSGSQPMKILSKHPNTGVFYPLQTFSKGKKLDVSQVPFCIEAGNESTERILVEMAQSISNTVYLVNSEERKVLHIAAVFACNFTNHLLAKAKDILDREKLDFDLLKPLITQTIQKAVSVYHPASVQTGPAIRNDQKTINLHLDYLASYPDERNIYRLLTDSIIQGEKRE